MLRMLESCAARAMMHTMMHTRRRLDQLLREKQRRIKCKAQPLQRSGEQTERAARIPAFGAVAPKSPPIVAPHSCFGWNRGGFIPQRENHNCYCYDCYYYTYDDNDDDNDDEDDNCYCC